MVSEDYWEDPRATYSDIVRTFHDEAFYVRIYNPEEIEYAVTQIEKILEYLKKGGLMAIY